MLVLLTMSSAQNALIVVSSKVVNRAMKVITKGKLARAVETWRQTHFGVVMSGSLQLSCKCPGGWSSHWGPPPSATSTQLHLRSLTWTMSRGMSALLGGSWSLHLELWMSMARLMSEGTVYNFLYWQSQWGFLSCLHLLCQLLYMGSWTQVPTEFQFV